jgi:protein-tyrosine phosphatase
MVPYSRHIAFESILNFRDLGGYRTREGFSVAWRLIFRSGELHHMTGHDIICLREKLGLAAALDLRGSRRVEQAGIGPLDEAGMRYYHVPLTIVTDADNDRITEPYPGFTNMGEVYLSRIRRKEYGQQIVRALEIIAGPGNLPLVFHCNAGKDRSGILAAILLSVLGVADEDIIEDYTMTAPYMKEFIERWDNDPVTADIHKNLPSYHLAAAPESMSLFLTTLRREYGSVEDYLKKHGAVSSMIGNLKKALLD